MFLATNISHISHDFLVTRDAKLNDHYYHIRILPSTYSRLTQLKMMLNIENEGLDACQDVIKIKTKEFTLTMHDEQDKKSVLAIDGEVINCDKINCKVSKSIKTFC